MIEDETHTEQKSASNKDWEQKSRKENSTLCAAKQIATKLWYHTGKHKICLPMRMGHMNIGGLRENC